jgi:hypothetical protein
VQGVEITVSVAWESTLYVTNFRDGMDDAEMRGIFEKVCIHISLPSLDANLSAVWNYSRRPMAFQAHKDYSSVLLCSIYNAGKYPLETEGHKSKGSEGRSAGGFNSQWFRNGWPEDDRSYL